jgi:filamin
MLFLSAGEPRKRAQLSVGSSSEVSLKVTETDISDLTASIRSPSGREEPCLLKRLPNGHLGKSTNIFCFNLTLSLPKSQLCDS